MVKCVVVGYKKPNSNPVCLYIGDDMSKADTAAGKPGYCEVHYIKYPVVTKRLYPAPAAVETSIDDILGTPAKKKAGRPSKNQK